jgi:hypothetical protein
MIRAFNGAREVGPLVLATERLDTPCFTLLFAHLAFIADEILDLAAALILLFFRRGAPFSKDGN